MSRPQFLSARRCSLPTMRALFPVSCGQGFPGKASTQTLLTANWIKDRRNFIIADPGGAQRSGSDVLWCWRSTRAETPVLCIDQPRHHKTELLIVDDWRSDRFPPKAASRPDGDRRTMLRARIISRQRPMARSETNPLGSPVAPMPFCQVFRLLLTTQAAAFRS